YRRLAISAEEVRQKRLQDAVELDPADIERQMTDATAAELERRANLERYYLEERIQREQEAATAMQKVRDSAQSNALGALQAFAGQSKKAAIALIAINKGLAIQKAI